MQSPFFAEHAATGLPAALAALRALSVPYDDPERVAAFGREVTALAHQARFQSVTGDGSTTADQSRPPPSALGIYSGRVLGGLIDRVKTVRELERAAHAALTSACNLAAEAEARCQKDVDALTGAVRHAVRADANAALASSKTVAAAARAAVVASEAPLAALESDAAAVVTSRISLSNAAAINLATKFLRQWSKVRGAVFRVTITIDSSLALHYGTLPHIGGEGGTGVRVRVILASLWWSSPPWRPQPVRRH